MHTTASILRDCHQRDSADLALLADIASRGMAGYIWGQSAEKGQSVFEVGRNIIRNDKAHFGYYRNWRLAELDGNIVGALNGYSPNEEDVTTVTNDKTLRPISELKMMALGSWYVVTLGVFPEYRGLGFGKRLLAEAEDQARIAGKNKVTLIVGTFNPIAYALYQKMGFRDQDRRVSPQIQGSSELGEWILMLKDI